MIVANIPAEIIEAEQKVSRWFAERNITSWKLGDSQSRVDRPERYLLYPPQMTFWQAFQGGMIPPKKDPAYISWLHTLPCAVTGTKKAITAHHVIGHGLRGHTDKTCDYMAFPIEAELHLPDFPRSLHAPNFGWRMWEAAHGSQLIFTLQTLMRGLYAGVLGRR